MKFSVRGRHIELTAALLAHVERCLRSAWRRFGQKIRHAAVQLTQLKRRRGRVAKQCRVTVTLTPADKVTVQANDADLHAAIDRAAGRLERSVARELERRREIPAP